MGYYSNFYLQMSNVEPTDLQRWYKSQYDYDLDGSGGSWSSESTLEIHKMKWYEFEEDIKKWLDPIASLFPIDVWVLRVGENGFEDDTVAYHFIKDYAMNSGVTMVKQRIDMRKLMHAIWGNGDIWAGPLTRG